MRRDHRWNRLVAGNRVFFPLATAYAIFVLALCWSGAFALLLIRLVRVRGRRN